MTTRIAETSAPSTHAGWASWASLLSPPHLKSLPAWTPYKDDFALGDRAVRARMRFLFTPIALQSLSAAGARAGLGPDGATGADKTHTDGVDMRPDPRLDRPIASRIPGADISEAAQRAEAERMGVHVPVEAPVLSANGKNAGLGPFAKGSVGDAARAGAMAKELAASVSKVRMAARKATGMVSRPVAAISDRSARVGITGSKPIAASGRGFEMRVPKGPVAQDRERWKSG